MRPVKLERCVPHPAAWASAGALFLFSAGVSAAMAIALPPLFELMERSPRLAWLGILLVWLAPIVAAACIHHVVQRVLDLGDSKRTQRAPCSSLWAGFVAWTAILFVTMTTSLLMLVLDPPPVDRGALSSLALVVTSREGMLRSIAWVVLAAYVYELERRARKASAD
jgi:hypothetical protein